MGVYGCGWVSWIARDTGNTETRQTHGIWGLAGEDLGAMVGEISPDMMFWGHCQKWSRMSEHGCRLVWMGAYACINEYGEQKQGKKRQKWVNRVIF